MDFMMGWMMPPPRAVLEGGNWRQHRFGQGEGVGDTKGAFAKEGDEVIADALAKTGLNNATRNHDGDDDQPDERVGEGRKRVLDRLVGGLGRIRGDGHAGDGDQRHGDDGNRAERQRLADNGGDGADEQRQQMPATGINAFRYWHSEPDNEGEGDRDQGRDGFDSHGDSPVDEENAS